MYAGIRNNGTLKVNNSTITRNSSTASGITGSNSNNVGGIYNSDSGTVTVNNSIIAGNIDARSKDPSIPIPDVLGNFISNGYNLIGRLTGSTGFNANEQLNVPLTNVLDTTLRDNGGSVKTYALVVGSPAINAGNNADIPADTTDLDGDGNTTEPVPFDERGAGFARVVRGRVDTGAFEAVVNVINGTPGRDTINGTPGNDIITGFQGRDILTGGDGADEFVFTSIRDAGKTITDFQVGTDKIILRQLLNSWGLGNLNFISAIAGGYLSFKEKGNKTIVLIDPDGSDGQSRAVKFIKAKNVSAADLNNPVNFAF